MLLNNTKTKFSYSLQMTKSVISASWASCFASCGWITVQCLQTISYSSVCSCIEDCRIAVLVHVINVQADSVQRQVKSDSLYMSGTREQHSKGDGVVAETHVHKKNYKSYDLLDISMA